MIFIQFSFSREPLKLLQYLRDEKVQWPYGPTYRSSCRSLQTVGWQTNEHGRGCPTVVYTVSIRAAVTGVWSEGSRFAQLWNKEVTSSTFFNINFCWNMWVFDWIMVNRNTSIYWTPPKAAQITCAQTSAHEAFHRGVVITAGWHRKETTGPRKTW